MSGEQQKQFENNVFDLIRLWAILQVTVGHCAQHLQVKLPLGITYLFDFPGVVVLFAISGFLVTASYDRVMDQAGGKGVYLKKRIARIFPGLWCSVIVSTVCIFVCYSRKPNVWEGIVYFVTQFLGCNFYTGDWLRGYGVGAPNGSLWTISTELQFYVFIMLVWRWIKQKGVLAWTGVTTAGICLSIISGIWGGMAPESTFYKLFTISLFPYLYIFMLGALVYRYFDKIIKIIDKYGIWILILLILGVAFGNRYVDVGEYVNVVSGFCLASAAIVLAYVSKRKVSIPFDISYGIYLYHMVLVNVMVELGMVGKMQYFLEALAGSIVCGFVSWYGVERRWLGRNSGKAGK